MDKILAAFAVFRQGACVANAAAWKNGQITVAMLTGFLGALFAFAKAFGVNIPLSDDQVAAVATSVLAVTGLLVHPAITVATSDKVGLPPKSDATISGGTPWK